MHLDTFLIRLFHVTYGKKMMKNNDFLQQCAVMFDLFFNGLNLALIFLIKSSKKKNQQTKRRQFVSILKLNPICIFIKDYTASWDEVKNKKIKESS